MAVSVRVDRQNLTTVRVGQQNATKVPSTIGGNSSVTINGMSDTDVTSLANGSLLVYDANTNQWVATNTLTTGNTKNFEVNGGTF